MAETQPDLAQYQNDHDLLIELRTEMRGLRGDIKEMKDATTDRSDDHETRLRALEQQRWTMAGAITVVATLVPYLIRVLFGV
jgi:hypothetical protein